MFYFYSGPDRKVSQEVAWMFRSGVAEGREPSVTPRNEPSEACLMSNTLLYQWVSLGLLIGANQIAECCNHMTTGPLELFNTAEREGDVFYDKH